MEILPVVGILFQKNLYFWIKCHKSENCIHFCHLIRFGSKFMISLREVSSHPQIHSSG